MLPKVHFLPLTFQNITYFMLGRNSLYNFQGGGGSNQSGRGGNNSGRGNGKCRLQITPPNAKSSTNPTSSTHSNSSLGGNSDVVNFLLDRAGR